MQNSNRRKIVNSFVSFIEKFKKITIHKTLTIIKTSKNFQQLWLIIWVMNFFEFYPEKLKQEFKLKQIID